MTERFETTSQSFVGFFQSSELKELAIHCHKS